MDNEPPRGSRAFLESNSLVAIVAFLILLLIAFIIVLRMGVSFSRGFLVHQEVLTCSTNDRLKHMMVIHQDPSKPGAIPIVRSINQNDGIEFTWSVWIYVDDLLHNKGQYKHIFHKGNDQIKTDGKNAGLVFQQIRTLLSSIHK